MRVTGSIKQNKDSTIPFILGVAGGSGSGKTYFARALVQALGKENCEIVYQDNFYFDQSKKFDFDGGSVNFDHPESIDFAKLSDCLRQLKSGVDTEIPIYDFATHSRQANTLCIKAKKIIIVDGILIFHPKHLRQNFDELVFFDTPEELRFARRLERDVKERGRTPEGVQNQFIKQVKPMHDQFVEPSKAFANTVVRELGHFESVLAHYLQKLKAL
jgi:uridine kinase